MLSVICYCWKTSKTKIPNPIIAHYLLWTVCICAASRHPFVFFLFSFAVVCLTHFVFDSSCHSNCLVCVCVIARDYREIIPPDGNSAGHVSAFYLTPRKGALMLLWWGLLSFHAWVGERNGLVLFKTKKSFEKIQAQKNKKSSLLLAKMSWSMLAAKAIFKMQHSLFTYLFYS